MRMRIPFDKSYTDILGEAVYAFAYYEWTIVYIVEYLENGFVQEYSREKAMTSGTVYKRFSELNTAEHKYAVDIDRCKEDFGYLYELRNALMHAHPITAKDGTQIFSYQTKPDKLFHDVQWPISDITGFIAKVDSAEAEAACLLDNLRF